MKCEIQVRTILQHAWAEIEHDIVYKSAEDIPFQLRRRFSSLAGLLEVADREFESLRQDEMNVRKKIETTIKRDDIDIPIDLDSVRFYLERYHNESNINPSKIRDLISLINQTGFKTIRDLHEILTPEALAKADKYINNAIAYAPEHIFPPGCRQKLKRECLIRYFIAIGQRFKIPDGKLEGFSHCPLFLPKEKTRSRDK